MKIILYTYAAGGMLIALVLGWHIVQNLNRYDWHYRRIRVLSSLITNIIFWPLLVIRYEYLINPSKLFKYRWRIVPRCGFIIRYQPPHSYYGKEVYGEFFFDALHVEQSIWKRVKGSPHLLNNQEGVILEWLSRRNTNIKAPTDVPSEWSRFKFVADELVRTGQAEIRCTKCGIEVPIKSLIKNDDQGQPGWNFDRIECPNGHELMEVETIHGSFS